MTKNDLINAVTENTEFSKGDVAVVVNETFDQIKNFLTDTAENNGDEKLQISGLGTFEVQYRGARKGRNPSTQQTIDIPAKKVAKFKPYKDLRDL